MPLWQLASIIADDASCLGPAERLALLVDEALDLAHGLVVDHSVLLELVFKGLGFELDWCSLTRLTFLRVGRSLDLRPRLVYYVFSRLLAEQEAVVDHCLDAAARTTNPRRRLGITTRAQRTHLGL